MIRLQAAGHITRYFNSFTRKFACSKKTPHCQPEGKQLLPLYLFLKDGAMVKDPFLTSTGDPDVCTQQACRISNFIVALLNQAQANPFGIMKVPGGLLTSMVRPYSVIMTIPFLERALSFVPIAIEQATFQCVLAPAAAPELVQ